MMKTVLLFAIVTTIAVVTLAQGPSDADIQAAMERGKTTPAKKLWGEIKKKQQYRMNRAGFGDPIEKKVLILSDLDRIALEAAEAKRQLREISADDIKKSLPFGIMEVLLEANCYNNMYAGSLPKWGPSGGVHVVLKVDDKVIQPLEKRVGQSDSASVLPQEHGVISRQGSMVTYTPLYRSAIYERASERAWFTFPALPIAVKTFTVTAISGEGKQKEKGVATLERRPSRWDEDGRDLGRGDF
jgi:hypothetical protein